MKVETLDEQLERTIGCAGQQEDEGIGIYATEVIVTITIPTGELAADSEEIAKNVAKFRGMERVTVSGNGCAVDWEAHVKRIGTA